MTTETAIAVVLTPILGPLLWWIIWAPAKAAHNYLWRRLPDGRMRRLLLKERRGEWVTINRPERPF